MKFKFIAIIALSIASLSLADVKHTFELDCNGWNDKPGKVAVAGSFNGWNKDANPLQKTDGHVWRGVVELPEGKHTYKFVIDGERWLTDPKGEKDLEEDDTFGGKNSGVIAGPDARKMPPAKPNAINAAGIKFDPESMDDVNVVSVNPLQVRMRLRAQKGDVEQVKVCTNTGAIRVLKKIDQTPLGYDVFGGLVDIDLSLSGTGIVHYSFELADGTAKLNFGRDGVEQTNPTEVRGQSQVFTQLVDKPFVLDWMNSTFTTPDWAKTAVWYQIFPERFRNGDTSNDPNTRSHERMIPWTAKWYEPAPGEMAGADNFYSGQGNVWNRRYGGDIAGLKASLPYLRKLGITAIYLNPIFEAESMHKYDTSDFRHIDDNMGVKFDNAVSRDKQPGDEPGRLANVTLPALADETDDPATWKFSPSDELFLDFVAEAHKQGFKVVLDGVFNHVGRAHPFFQDVLKNGKRSKYADWFEITEWGDEANWKEMPDPYVVHGKPGGIQWKAWDEASGHLPVFKKDANKGLAPGPYAHIMAITKRWLAPNGDSSKGIDGWRLDVANDIPHPFWRDWRKVVKETKADAVIFGEIWSGAEPWINAGDQFDAVMNYQFAMPAQDFFVDVKTAIPPSVFAQQLVRLCYRYPFQSALVMMNLFDSHDTDRFPSMFVNPDRPYDGQNRLQDNGKDYSPRKPNEIEHKKMLQAVALQHAFVGAPMTYYGNETGMWAADDPSNRQPMLWQDLEPYGDPEIKFDQEKFDWFRRCIATRAALPALQTGDFFPVLTDDANGVLVFGRRKGEQVVYVVINRSDSARDVTFAVSPAKSQAFVNFLDESTFDISEPVAGDPAARTMIQPNKTANPVKVAEGKLKISMKPFGAAILAAK